MSVTKLRPLAVITLALLRERDLHPYEMLRLMRVRGKDRLVKLQNGTFYHQISVLEREGFITEAGVDREGNRPERTTYTLCPAGYDIVEAWVRDRLAQVGNDADFQVALSEAHNIPRGEAVTLLRQRVAHLEERAREIGESLDGARSCDVDGQFLLEVDRALYLTNADLEWTTDTVSRIADPSYSWGFPSQRHDAKKHSMKSQFTPSEKAAHA